MPVEIEHVGQRDGEILPASLLSLEQLIVGGMTVQYSLLYSEVL